MSYHAREAFYGSSPTDSSGSRPNQFASHNHNRTYSPTSFVYGYTSVVPMYGYMYMYLFMYSGIVQYNTFNILLRTIQGTSMYKYVHTSTTTANKQGNPSDLMRGKKRVDPLSSQHLPAPRPSTLFSRKKIPRRGHLACGLRTYCRSRKACPTQTGYSVLYKY